MRAYQHFSRSTIFYLRLWREWAVLLNIGKLISIKMLLLTQLSRFSNVCLYILRVFASMKTNKHEQKCSRAQSKNKTHHNRRTSIAVAIFRYRSLGRGHTQLACDTYTDSLTGSNSSIFPDRLDRLILSWMWLCGPRAQNAMIMWLSWSLCATIAVLVGDDNEGRINSF